MLKNIFVVPHRMVTLLYKHTISEVSKTVGSRVWEENQEGRCLCCLTCKVRYLVVKIIKQTSVIPLSQEKKIGKGKFKGWK